MRNNSNTTYSFLHINSFAFVLPVNIWTSFAFYFRCNIPLSPSVSVSARFISFSHRDQTVYTNNMDNFRSGTTTTAAAVLSFVIGLLSIVEYGHAASVKSKDDVFNINITMPNFNTTQVWMSRLKS